MKWNELLTAHNTRFGKALARYKWVLLVIGAGLVLLVLPPVGSGQTAEEPGMNQKPNTFDLAEIELKFSEALSEITGAGEVTVVLSVKTGARQVLAEDSKYSDRDSGLEEESSAVILSRGSGVQETVTLQEIYPQFQGALVICTGGDDPNVRLKLTEATAALTGLGADKISICSRGK